MQKDAVKETGTLFGIDSGTYDLWKSAKVEEAKPLTMKSLNDAFKSIYGKDSIADMMPPDSPLMKMMGLSEQIGQPLPAPINLSAQQGFTYASGKKGPNQHKVLAVYGEGAVQAIAQTHALDPYSPSWLPCDDVSCPWCEY